MRTIPLLLQLDDRFFGHGELRPRIRQEMAARSFLRANNVIVTCDYYSHELKRFTMIGSTARIEADSDTMLMLAGIERLYGADARKTLLHLICATSWASIAGKLQAFREMLYSELRPVTDEQTKIIEDWYATLAVGTECCLYAADKLRLLYLGGREKMTEEMREKTILTERKYAWHYDWISQAHANGYALPYRSSKTSWERSIRERIRTSWHEQHKEQKG